MKIGVAYYPEQWPKERWDEDARNMAQLGIDVVRLGEFAWSRLEPRRERIQMDWLEEAIDVLASHGMKIILGTPTAAPPPWLFTRHPTILPERADGRKFYYGSRRHACLNNPAYLKYVRRIVTELAKKFADNQHLFAWQIDNEVSFEKGGVCYCDECEQAFRMWLKRRYGTIDRLNKRWGTAFWSQEFVDWHEIPIPRETVVAPHPSLLLDYKRFVSAQTRAFVKKQKDIIRDYSRSDVPITVNEPEPILLPHVNAYSLAELQDVVSLDNYPSRLSRLSMTIRGLDFARSLKNNSFWIMEQQAGATVNSFQPRPGQLRLWACQSFFRGADLICFFRWKTAPSGQETHWHGILDSDGMPRRRYSEIKQTVEDLKSHEKDVGHSLPLAKVGIYVDFESAWALEANRFGAKPDYFQKVSQFHEILRQRGITADFVAENSPLDDYSLVVAPSLFISNPKLISRLEVYTRKGGVLLATAPSGHVTTTNTTGDIRPPGALSSLLGVEVLEMDRVEKDGNSVKFNNDGSRFEAGKLCCILEPRGSDVLACYEKDYYAGSAAFTVAEAEYGKALFLGAELQEKGLERVLDYALKTAGIEPVPWKASEEVEVVELKNETEHARKFSLLNHSHEKKVIDFAEEWTVKDVFSNHQVENSLELEPYQVTVVELCRT